MNVLCLWIIFPKELIQRIYINWLMISLNLHAIILIIHTFAFACIPSKMTNRIPLAVSSLHHKLMLLSHPWGTFVTCRQFFSDPFTQSFNPYCFIMSDIFLCTYPRVRLLRSASFVCGVPKWLPFQSTYDIRIIWGVKVEVVFGQQKRIWWWFIFNLLSRETYGYLWSFWYSRYSENRSRDKFILLCVKCGTQYILLER